MITRPVMPGHDQNSRQKTPSSVSAKETHPALHPLQARPVANHPVKEKGWVGLENTLNKAPVLGMLIIQSGKQMIKESSQKKKKKTERDELWKEKIWIRHTFRIYPILGNHGGLP